MTVVTSTSFVKLACSGLNSTEFVKPACGGVNSSYNVIICMCVCQHVHLVNLVRAVTSCTEGYFECLSIIVRIDRSVCCAKDSGL